MEPAQTSVIYYTTVDECELITNDVYVGYNVTALRLANMPCKMFYPGDTSPAFTVGDRVKVTITKEPLCPPSTSTTPPTLGSHNV
jgi:hypothetical protein